MLQVAARSRASAAAGSLLACIPALDSYDAVWAAAGHAHTVFPTSFTELIRITGGTPAHVA